MQARPRRNRGATQRRPRGRRNPDALLGQRSRVAPEPGGTRSRSSDVESVSDASRFPREWLLGDGSAPDSERRQSVRFDRVSHWTATGRDDASSSPAAYALPKRVRPAARMSSANPEGSQTACRWAKRPVPESLRLHRLRSTAWRAARKADLAQPTAESAASNTRGGKATREPLRGHALPRIEGNRKPEERSEHANAAEGAPVRDATLGRSSRIPIPCAVIPLRWPDRWPSHLLVAQGTRRLHRQPPRVGTANGMQSRAARDHRLHALGPSAARRDARLAQCSGMTPENQSVSWAGSASALRAVGDHGLGRRGSRTSASGGGSNQKSPQRVASCSSRTKQRKRRSQ
jgi:hypothetical protein